MSLDTDWGMGFVVENKIAPTLVFDAKGKSRTKWVSYSSNFDDFSAYMATRYSVKLPDALPRGGKADLARRSAALIERVSKETDSYYDGVPSRIRKVKNTLDVETMSLYEKYLTSGNSGEMSPRIDSCVSTLRAMGHESVSELVNDELLLIEDMARKTVRTVAPNLFTGKDEWYLGEALTWIAFDNLSIARPLLSWVGNSGVTDAGAVLSFLPEMKTSHAALCEGVL